MRILEISIQDLCFYFSLSCLFIVFYSLERFVRMQDNPVYKVRWYETVGLGLYLITETECKCFEMTHNCKKWQILKKLTEVTV